MCSATTLVTTFRITAIVIMRRLLPALLLATVLFGAACDSLVDSDPVRVPPRTLTEAEIQLLEADNAFGLKLFRAISDEAPGENVFLSPLSISMALGMTLNGARGETREGMREALELQGLGDEEINRAYRAVIDLLRGLDPKVRFDIANSIWYRTGFRVEDDFLESAREFFDAELAELDFGRPDAPDIINAWIERATEGLIKEMIDSVGPDVVMYIINAIYFKGDWASQFDPADTRDETFRTGDGREVTVPMMHQQTRLPFASTETYFAVDLPYGDSLYSMSILLPREGVNVDDVIAQLDTDSWTRLAAQYRNDLVDLKMPRFEMSYEKELNDVLSILGMDRAFVPGVADFSGISRDAELYISMVKHAAHIRVDEEGTEAAAATVVEIELTSVPLVHQVHLNRPFVFSIRERHSGAILFIGKANDVS